MSAVVWRRFFSPHIGRHCPVWLISLTLSVHCSLFLLFFFILFWILLRRRHGRFEVIATRSRNLSKVTKRKLDKYERCHIRYTQRIERLRIEGGFCVLTGRLCEARCVLRIAYCVLRMGCDARRPAVSMVAYCVLRIAYGVRRPKPAVSMVAYCVLRIAYCASAPFEAHCVLRIAYCVLRIWGALPNMFAEMP